MVNVRNEHPMMIRPFLHGQAFDPEVLEAMEFAFVTTCDALALSDRVDGMNQRVADKIVELAKRGIHNRTALRLAAIREFFRRRDQQRSARQ
jgi:elongation factor P hydroxylase